jgi:hypothetical protein
MQSNISREFVVLNDFPDLIEKYCSNNGVNYPATKNHWVFSGLIDKKEYVWQNLMNLLIGLTESQVKII